MATRSASINCTIIPKRQQKHYSYNESVDESAELITNEPVEVEKESPAEENESIENVGLNELRGPAGIRRLKAGV